MTRRVVILGATSAIAERTARLYAAEGADLVLVGRNGARLEEIGRDLQARGAGRIKVHTTDFGAAHDPAVTLAGLLQWLGEADVILLAYGILGDQERAEHDWEHAREILEVGFTSAALWCLAAARALEQQQHGALVVIGSVAGDRGRQSNYVYGSAKAGLGVLVQGIAHRLAQRGGRARAVLVKPGFVDTPMTDHLAKGGPLWASPEAVAAVIRKAADRGGPIVYAPWFWRFILLIIRLVPAGIFHKTKL